MNKLREQKGMIILTFLIVLPFLILIATYYMREALTSFQVARFDQLHTKAQLAADAGADYAVEKFSQDNTWSTTVGDPSSDGNGEITLNNQGNVRTTYKATISGNDSLKTINIIGKSYWPATSSTAARSVSLYVDLRPVTSGLYSVISGAGGLVMSNSSKVVGGDVFINGTITMSNSSQIGLSTNPVNVKVAHQVCPNPADATYPRVCNSGENGQPISISNTAHIYGQVKATNQTDGSGMSNPGLVAGSVPPEDLPTYDRDAQKNAVPLADPTRNITGAAASCSGNTTRTWKANTKITGNVSVSNKCKVTVQGNVWITGSLSISNNQTELIVDDSLLNTRPVIMVDGAAGINISNSASLRTNSSGMGFGFYTFYSTAGCSPDCATVTGTDLANSRGVTTISVNTSGDAANSLFYAYWSQVQLANSGQIGALIGQTIRLSNSGTITFGTNLSTGSITWVVKGYRRHY